MGHDNNTNGNNRTIITMILVTYKSDGQLDRWQDISAKSCARHACDAMDSQHIIMT